MSPIYIRGSAIVIVVYDITNKVFCTVNICCFTQILLKRSLEGAKDWIVRSKDLLEKDCVVAIVGSKSDMNEVRVIQKEDVDKYCKELDYPFIECSSKTGENIHELFEIVVNKRLQKPDMRESIAL